MNMPPDITPESIHNIVTEREIPLRRRTFAAEYVNEIFRYGAGIGAIIEQYEHIGRGMEQARRNIVKAKDAGRSFPSGRRAGV